MRRLIVTGPNGAGKSHLAARLAAIRPDVPLISFDGLKLSQGWKLRPRSEVDADLLRIVQQDAWILEGGPGLLSHAISCADCVIWLDPPVWLRAWRLAVRPIRNRGKSRPELPEGNVDWPLEQYRFALRSLRNGTKFRDSISRQLAATSGLRIWRVRYAAHMTTAIEEWRNAGR